MAEREPAESQVESVELKQRKRLERVFKRGNEEEKHEAAKELGEKYTHDSVFLEETLIGIDLAMSELLRGNKAGHTLLQIVADYYEAEALTFKVMPNPRVDKKNYDRVKKLAFQSRKKLAQYSRRNDEEDYTKMISTVINSSFEGLENLQSQETGQGQALAILRDAGVEKMVRANMPVFNKQIELLNYIVQNSGESIIDAEEIPERYGNIFSYLQQISEFSKTDSRAIPVNFPFAIPDAQVEPVNLDALDKKFGGVSLNDIINHNVNINNPKTYETSSKMILQYLSHKRSGDIFWELLADKLFQTGISIPSGVNVKETLKGQHDFTEKVVRWHGFLADQIYLPALIDNLDIEDEELEKYIGDQNTIDNLAHLFAHSNVVGLHRLLRTAIYTAHSDYHDVESFHPDQEPDVIYDNTPLAALAVSSSRILSPIIASNMKLREIADHAGEDFCDRIGLEGIRRDEIVQGISAIGKTEYDKDLLVEFSDWMRPRIGESTLEMLSHKGEELLDAAEDILKGAEEEFSVWPDPRSVLNISFDKKSPIYRLGLDKSVWSFPENMNEDVHFRLDGEDGRVALGTINFVDGTVELLGDDGSPEFSDISTLLKFTATCIARDICARETVYYKKTGDTRKYDSELEMETKHPRTPLPRKRKWEHHETLLAEDIAEEVRDREADESTRKPRWVSASTRRVKWGAKFEGALQAMEEAEKKDDWDAYEIALNKLEKYYEKLALPDMRKIRKLAPAFQPRRIQNPFDSRLEITIETWVRGHYSPRLQPDGDFPEDDLLPYSEKYFRRHRAGVPALDFLYEVLEDVTGLSQFDDADTGEVF